MLKTFHCCNLSETLSQTEAWNLAFHRFNNCTYMGKEENSCIIRTDVYWKNLFGEKQVREDCWGKSYLMIII